MIRNAAIALWLGSATIAVLAQSAAAPHSGPLLDGKRLVMQIEQVATDGHTAIFGDPAKPGTYVVRSRLAPNAMTRPRYYDQDRWITVLKGTWWVGQGEMYKTDRLVPVREGGMMYQPAKLPTYDLAGSSGVVLQIFGTGPVQSTHAELDSSGKPVPVGGPYPELQTPESGRGRGRGGRRGQPPPTQ